MERIKRALELARRERDIGVGIAPTGLGSVAPMPGRRASPNPQTRSVELSAALLERQRVLHAGSDAAVRQAYKMLRTQVLQRMREHSLQTIAVVSPTPGDGKSVTATNLAISIAQEPNHTALLVDADFRQPALKTLFGIDVEIGVEDCLKGEATLSQAMVKPDMFERLVLLPARAQVQDSSELLASKDARALVAELKSRYADRIVIFDLPPVLLSDDALALMPCVDAALVVASEGQTRREDLARTVELLRATRIVGTVLNRSSQAEAAAY